jgi:Cu(I)/Ag(I) efflux system membrane fusion protein
MKNKLRWVIGIFLSLIIAVGIYQWGVTQGRKATHTDAAPPKPSTEKKPLYWHDPMVPNQRFDKPGKSPFMDMDLVPVYSDNAGNEGNTVSINAQVQQNLGVRTAEVTRGQLKSDIRVVGNVAFDERDVALVQARSAGFVEHVYVRAPFERVKKGQALLEVYMPEWIAAQEDYLTLQRMNSIQDSQLGSLLKDAQQRMRLVGMNEEQIAKVIANKKVQRRVTLTAPISGVVTELTVREGMTLNVGAPLYRINGLNKVWVNAEVPENLTSFIQLGSRVQAHTPALPGARFLGRINAILPDINTTTRTMKVRIELSNPELQLIPGMFTTIRITETPPQENVLLIPSEALIQTGSRNVVTVMQPDGAFKIVNVEVGHEADGQTEIKKGLEAGQQVVVSGQFLIDSEASLKGESHRLTPNQHETQP